MPCVSRTRATLRSAEFGFFGVTVATRVQTPRRWGAATRRLAPAPDLSPGVVTFFCGRPRPLRISWLVLGTGAHRSEIGASLPSGYARREANPGARCRWRHQPVRLRRPARRAPRPLSPDQRNGPLHPRGNRRATRTAGRRLRDRLGDRVGGPRQRDAAQHPRPSRRPPFLTFDGRARFGTAHWKGEAIDEYAGDR